jgi:dTDP-4-dehydrorhamnose 3,5-epimerase-like enzyme
MRTEALEIPELKLVVAKRFADARGHLKEAWSDRVFREKVGDVTFVEDNQTFSIKNGRPAVCAFKGRRTLKANS